jgi:hypothetical protein
MAGRSDGADVLDRASILHICLLAKSMLDIIRRLADESPAAVERNARKRRDGIERDDPAASQDMLDLRRCNCNALNAQGMPEPPHPPASVRRYIQMKAPHSRRTDDHRIQEAICKSGDQKILPELNAPRPTIQRLPESEDDAKRIRLREIERSGKGLPLNAALRIVRTSPIRFGRRAHNRSHGMDMRKTGGAMRRMRRGNEFVGIAIATPALQNVVRRSRAAYNSYPPRCDSTSSLLDSFRAGSRVLRRDSSTATVSHLRLLGADSLRSTMRCLLAGPLTSYSSRTAGSSCRPPQHHRCPARAGNTRCKETGPRTVANRGRGCHADANQALRMTHTNSTAAFRSSAESKA